jgi:plastocyanin
VQRGALLLIAALGASSVLVLAGCGGSSDDGGAEATTAGPAAPTASAATPATEAGAATGAPPASSAGDAAGAVHLELLSFTPEELKVAAGTTVQWVDDNPIAHTITSGAYEVGADGLRTSEAPDGTFDGTVAATGDAFSFTFSEPGTYPYYCSIHKGMNATVLVTD